MHISDVVAALELLEQFSHDESLRRVNEASSKVTGSSNHVAQIYGSGGWRRYFLRWNEERGNHQ
jgi:hypothetical protein